MPAMGRCGTPSDEISSTSGSGGGGTGNRVPVTDVVDHPHGHASLRGLLDRAADDLLGLSREVEVVLGEVERLLRLVDERLDRTRDLDGLLPAVGQRANGEGWWSADADEPAELAPATGLEADHPAPLDRVVVVRARSARRCP